MSIPFQQYPHEGIQTLHPYIPGKSIEELAKEQGLTDIIKIASNENPLGCSPLVHETLSRLSGTYIATYPAPSLHPISQKLSEALGIEENQLMLSNGSDFIFTLLLMLFALHQNKHMLTHEKAFLTYEIQAKTLGIPFKHSPLLPNWQIDVDAMIKACNEGTGLVFIANPNNPTGTFLDKRTLIKLLDGIPPSTIIVLDEAYYEFAYEKGDEGGLGLLSFYPNLVVTRTFSKAYGLVGMRLGYAVADACIIELLKRIQLPFTVNQIAMAAGVAALNDDTFLANTLALNKEGMNIMREGLDAMGLDCIPSCCNFITFDCGQVAMPVYQALLKKGVIVRPLHAYGMPNHLRASIGKKEHTLRFLDALESCLVV